MRQELNSFSSGDGSISEDEIMSKERCDDRKGQLMYDEPITRIDLPITDFLGADEIVVNLDNGRKGCTPVRVEGDKYIVTYGEIQFSVSPNQIEHVYRFKRTEGWHGLS